MTLPTSGADLPLILLAEDRDDEAFLLQEALQLAGIANPLAIASHGKEVVAYLEGKGPYSNRKVYPLPRLLLLDINMPYMDGFEVLGWLSVRPQFRCAGVVMLTSSSLPADLHRARDMGADDYVVKPSSLTALTHILQRLQTRWLNVEAKHYFSQSATSSQPEAV